MFFVLLLYVVMILIGFGCVISLSFLNFGIMEKRRVVVVVFIIFVSVFFGMLVIE